jgi:hypothetical protein
VLAAVCRFRHHAVAPFGTRVPGGKLPGRDGAGGDTAPIASSELRKALVHHAVQCIEATEILLQRYHNSIVLV